MGDSWGSVAVIHPVLSCRVLTTQGDIQETETGWQVWMGDGGGGDGGG